MILIIQCRDQVGLVAAISGYLAEQQINIISMREYVDVQASQFFARLEVEDASAKRASGPEASQESATLEAGLKRVLPENALIQAKVLRPKKIAVLVTKEHHCLSDLLIRNHFKTAGFEIDCVLGNYESLRDICNRFSVPFFHLSHENKSKEVFEAELRAQLQTRDLDFIVLAKFMRILSPDFVKEFRLKLINIHHSFLPAFIGANPYRQAHARGVKLIGATAHFVTDDLDEGPIIAQQIISVDHADTPRGMMKLGKEIETAVLSKTLQLLSEDRVLVYENRTVVFE